MTFDVEGTTCAAWLYLPARPGGPVPVVVMAHGLSGTRRDGLAPFAERFAAVGCAALVFDHRGFGDSGGTADVFSPRRQLRDWAGAIACARDLPGVAPDQVVTFGSSMGGGNALAAAARDPRVVAAISQVPLLDLLHQAHRSRTKVQVRLLLTALRGGFVPAVGQPHEVALINAPDSAQGWLRVVESGEDSRWRNRVSTRWLLGRPFRPARCAGTLHCPWLVCVGEADRVAAPGPAIAAARRSPHGELRTYAGLDHFDVYAGRGHELLVADQLEFLTRHLDL